MGKKSENIELGYQQGNPANDHNGGEFLPHVSKDTIDTRQTSRCTQIGRISLSVLKYSTLLLAGAAIGYYIPVFIADKKQPVVAKDCDPPIYKELFKNYTQLALNLKPYDDTYELRNSYHEDAYLDYGISYDLYSKNIPDTIDKHFMGWVWFNDITRKFYLNHYFQ